MLRTIYGRLPLKTGRLGSSFTSHRIVASRRFSTEETKEHEKTQSKTHSTISLSDACVQRLADITKIESDKFLRVIVDGGGCSGFQYKFELDNKINDDDMVFGPTNSRVVVDAVSMEYCAGATIDYQTELIKSGFRIVDNPKAEQGCSCGASFALKMD